MPPFGSIGHTRTGNATVNALTTWSVLVAALLRGSNCPAHPAGSENVMLLVSELDAQSDPMFAMAAAMNREIPSTLLGARLHLKKHAHAQFAVCSGGPRIAVLN